jgi:hypothetical protein
VVGTGTEAGVSYIDVRLSGTPSAAGNYFLQFDTNTAIAALNGQTWTSSLFNKLASGSLSGVTEIRLATSQRDGSGNDLGSAYNVFAPSATMTRSTHTLTNSSASTAFELTYVQFVLSGAAIDFTIRLGLPQLEQGAFATSPIPTTTAAATRAADVAVVSSLAGWFNSAQGTLLAEFIPNAPASYATNQYVAALSDNSLSNRVSMFRVPATGLQANRITSAGTGANPGDGAASTTGAVNKVAIAYGAGTNQGGASVNGGAVTLSSPGAVPTGISQLSLGCSESTSAAFLNGWLRRVTYYPTRLPDSTMRALTS